MADTGTVDARGAIYCQECKRAYDAARYRTVVQSPQPRPQDKTECKRGHPLSGDNLYVNPRGERQCRECNKLRAKRVPREKQTAAHKRWADKNQQHLWTYRQLTREHTRLLAYAREFGLQPEQVKAMLEAQGWKCAICKSDLHDERHLDHNHLTNSVRGFLCRGCNVMLGCAKDNPTTLREGAKYLEQ